MTALGTRRLGCLETASIGLGCMGMSGMYGPADRAEGIATTHAVHPVVDLQIEYSVITRGIEAEILPTCRELDIGITAYGVLSRGLLSGRWDPARAGGGDFRAHSPRFLGENLAHNMTLVDALA